MDDRLPATVQLILVVTDNNNAEKAVRNRMFLFFKKK